MFAMAPAPFNKQYTPDRITTVLFLGGARPDFCDHGEVVLLEVRKRGENY